MIRGAWPLNFGGSPRTCFLPDSVCTSGADRRRTFIVLLKRLIDKDKNEIGPELPGFWRWNSRPVNDGRAWAPSCGAAPYATRCRKSLLVLCN